MNTCPLCRNGSVRAFVKDGMDILDCAHCGHRFYPLEEIRPLAHVEAHYGDSYFRDGGAGYADYLSEGRLLQRHGQRYGKLLSSRMKPGHVLDIGSAAGFFLKGLMALGWKGNGIEPNGKMALYARERLGVQVEEGAFESYQVKGSYDLVSMIQVIAHFIDPAESVRKAAGCLKDGGYLLIETWNRSSWTAKAFGKTWHEYSPPTVLHWFDKSGLARIADGAGLKLVGAGRPAKWLDGAHAKSLLAYALRDSSARFLLPLFRLVPDSLPIPYPSEDLVWMLFRKPENIPVQSRASASVGVLEPSIPVP